MVKKNLQIPLGNCRLAGARHGRAVKAAVAAVLAGGVALPAPALAQLTTGQVIEPQRIEDSLSDAAQPQSRPDLVEVRPVPQSVPDGAVDATFVLRQLTIEGANAIAPATLMELWNRQPGEVVSVSEVYRLAAAITRAYAEAGYALSFAVIPEQRIEDGTVRITVIEGFVTDVVLQGDAGNATSAIRAMLRPLETAGPLRSADLERALLLVNDLPGTTARASLSPAENVVGGSVLTVVIDRKPVEGEIGYSNYLPAQLERHMAAASLRLNGALGGTEQLWFSTLRSLAGDYYWNAAGGFSVFMGNDGARLAVDGLHARVHPSDPALEKLEYEGGSNVFRASLAYPLIRSRARNLSLELAGELNNADIDLLGQAFQRDRLRMLSTALTYDFAGADRSVTLLRAGLEQGLGIFDARGDSRANGSPVYTLIEMQAQRDQPLAATGGGRLSVFASASGQAALHNALLSAAECGLGGRQYGRGFDPGVVTGDHCVLGSAELRWTAPFDQFGTDRPAMMQAYGFVDGGITWQKGTLQPGEPREASGASGGVGLRFSLPPSVSASIEGSHAIKRPAGVPSASDFLLSAAISLRF